MGKYVALRNATYLAIATVFGLENQELLMIGMGHLCHVSCIHFQGLRFYTELEIYIRFNCTKFISQFHLLTIFQAWFITNDSKFCLVFVLLHENLVDFLQIKYTSNLFVSQLPILRTQRVKVDRKGEYCEFSKTYPFSNPVPRIVCRYQQEWAIKWQKWVPSYCRLIGRHWTEIVSFFFMFGFFSVLVLSFIMT